MPNNQAIFYMEKRVRALLVGVGLAISTGVMGRAYRTSWYLRVSGERQQETRCQTTIGGVGKFQRAAVGARDGSGERAPESTTPRAIQARSKVSGAAISLPLQPGDIVPLALRMIEEGHDQFRRNVD